ncbi:MAG: S8 family peptidase, partial [Candidatus Rokuibacteriota bacterium]
MAIEIPGPLVEFILLGPTDDRRQLQDSPILGDVWIAFARTPGAALDLLITPYMTQHAGLVAEEIERGVSDDDPGRANIAYLQGIVVARLTFDEVLRVVVPLTKWWNDRWIKDGTKGSAGGGAGAPRHAVMEYGLDRAARVIDAILGAARGWVARSADVSTVDFAPLDRYITLTGLVLWAAGQPSPPDEDAVATSQRTKRVLERASGRAIASILGEVVPRIRATARPDPLVWQVSLNRTATPALTKSVPSVKADAARTLFKVRCREIGWAVIDSGLDGGHPAFNGDDGATRVRRCFDFTAVRKIIS